MDPLPIPKPAEPATIAIIGGGPAGVVAAIALARRGIRTAVFERGPHPDNAPRFNPDRSYTIDITGHGYKALRHIDACDAFDAQLIRFKGIKVYNGPIESYDGPGWIGSRGDILRSLMAVATERYRTCITFTFNCRVSAVDVQAGSFTYVSESGEPATDRFDLIVGADGAGSVVREALLNQVPGFAVVRKSFPNYCTMIELDRVGDRLDPQYLHGLADRPFGAAGAIKGETGSGPARWFCAIGTRQPLALSSAEDARHFFSNKVPRVLDFASNEAIAAFAGRTCYHIGQKLTCSQLFGGKAVLIGDAASPFPPIGQGVNAAMESAMVIDECIGELGAAPDQLLDAARRYNHRWKPEADAVSWMSEKSLFENRYHASRAKLAMRFGLDIFGAAKRADLPYSAVLRAATRRWPLWIG